MKSLSTHLIHTVLEIHSSTEMQHYAKQLKKQRTPLNLSLLDKVFGIISRFGGCATHLGKSFSSKLKYTICVLCCKAMSLPAIYHNCCCSLLLCTLNAPASIWCSCYFVVVLTGPHGKDIAMFCVHRCDMEMFWNGTAYVNSESH